MHYPNVIFSGGGSRCFWQLGFWEGARRSGVDLGAGLEFAGSTSAGCATATAAVLGRSYDALEIFKQLTSENPRNIHWQNLRPWSPDPVLPHAGMYRQGMELFLQDTPIAALRAAPLSFLMSSHPRFLSGALGAACGFLIYALEKRFANPLHPQWARQLGYRPIVGDVASCTSKAEFIDMVLAASCVPPVLPGGRFAGQNVLDGGLVDNVPVLLAHGRPGKTLALLSRRYRGPLPRANGITYVQPSQPIEIDKFDYANPRGLQKVFDLGLTDGERFVVEARDDAN